jgi:hypothetical protein
VTGGSGCWPWEAREARANTPNERHSCPNPRFWRKSNLATMVEVEIRAGLAGSEQCCSLWNLLLTVCARSESERVRVTISAACAC